MVQTQLDLSKRFEKTKETREEKSIVLYDGDRSFTEEQECKRLIGDVLKEIKTGGSELLLSDKAEWDSATQGPQTNYYRRCV